ncbi:MAG: hypothetical protein EA368_01260 [Leptolyngbya sp. DLM2.Bin27]|nr:MAG: hypothetical protein EA368_01260 [Leptolyngbya sp. DLM2.Bin27]
MLALISLGLHGVLLGLPMPESSSTVQDLATDLDEPIEVIDVVRLPASPDPATPPAVAAEPAPPTASPPAQSPVQPRASAPPPQVSPAPAAPAAATPAPAPAVDLGPLPPEPPPQTLDDRLRDPEAYIFNQQAKSLIADERTFYTSVVSNWLEAAAAGITNDDLLPMQGEKLPPLQVAYPLNRCLTPPPAVGVVGVIVDTAGQRLEAPVLLDSTGYSVFDDKAIEMAMRQVFPAQPAGSPLPNPRGYWLPVQVQYNADGCNT